MAADPQVVQTIIDIGRQRGLGDREIIAALSTGLVESGLQNVSHGDRDSLGVFQQRPSQGWGTPAQVQDVAYATNKFYDAVSQFDKPGISGAELAARIQRPAAQFRGRYADRWDEARRLYQEYSGGTPSGGDGASQMGGPFDAGAMLAQVLATLSDGVAGRPSEQRITPGGSLSGLTGQGAMQAGAAILQQAQPQAQPQTQPQGPTVEAGIQDLGEVVPGQDGVPEGLQQNAARGAAAVRRMFGFDGTLHGVGQRDNKSDHPHGNAIDVMTGDDVELGQRIADFFVANAQDFGVKYVIFDQRIASERGGWKWRRMEDRGSPTANHRDHPHISFYG